MPNKNIIKAVGCFFVLFVFAIGSLFGQTDLSGDWAPRIHEDALERGPGPALGDYLGLPVNDAARLFADSWDASRLTLLEHQCMPHISPYVHRDPFAMRIWEEKDPNTQQVIAVKIYHSYGETMRTIWMDGRPHPPEYARHTWLGFSTGKWDGPILNVTTTHVKQGWVRRNGLPESDLATSVEHVMRHGDILTHVVIITDPIYLTEPLIKSQNFVLDAHWEGVWTFPCEYAEEVNSRGEGWVPHHLPGENNMITEFGEKYHLPAEVTRGGAETMYPEYQRKLNSVPKSTGK